MRGAPQPGQAQPDPVVRQLTGGQAPVPRGLGVPDRLDGIPVFGVPAGGGIVQRGQLGRVAAAQFQLEQVGEELVVTEPRPARIKRDHERARLLELLQNSLAARAPGQQVGQLAIDAFQYRGPQQQPPGLIALPIQHLGQQVLGDGALAAAELGRETFRVGVAGQRQRRQPQPRRPALGPVIQRSHRRVRQRHPDHGRVKQRPRLRLGEPQIGRADLSKLPRQPQPVQSKPQVVPGDQHEAQGGRRAHDQQLQLAQRIG